MQRWKAGFFGLTLALVVLGLCPTSAQAQVSRELSGRCLAIGDPTFVEACRTMLQTPGVTALQRALAHDRLARDLAERGQVEAALTEANAAIEANTNPELSGFFLKSRADIYYSAARWQEAFEDYDALVAISPTYDFALYRRGYMHLLLGRPDEARSSFEAALAAPVTQPHLREHSRQGIQGADFMINSRREAAEMQRANEEMARDNARYREQRAAAQAEREANAVDRLLDAGVVAALGGDTRQIGQALSGQEITASTPQPTPGTIRAGTSSAPSVRAAPGRLEYYIPSNRTCIHFEKIEPSNVAGPLYEVRSTCSLETSFSIGAYADGYFRGGGATLASGEVKRIRISDLRLEPYWNLPLTVIWACPTKEAVESTLGGQRLVGVQYDRDRDQCRVMGESASMPTAQ